jgi:hypothetical protein
MAGKNHKSKLTEYEQGQVARIAAWKSAFPNPVAELFKLTTLPVARLVERVIPDSLAELVIDKAYDASAVLAGSDDVKRRAGVNDLAELRGKPLEECNRLAMSVGLTARGIAAIEGAATGAGGWATTIVDIPLLFVLAMRTIIKIGHCYGYPLDSDRDRRLVLGILIVGASGSRETRLERLGQLRDVEELALEEAQEEIMTEEAASLLFQLEELGIIPGLGAASGGLLNFFFMRKVELAARCVFEENWLKDVGKIEEIEPAPLKAHVPATGKLGHVLGRLAYRGCYYVGYGVTLPAYAVAVPLIAGGHALARVGAKRAGTASLPERVERAAGATNGKARDRAAALSTA